jgi:hypothetical protein
MYVYFHKNNISMHINGWLIQQMMYTASAVNDGLLAGLCGLFVFLLGQFHHLIFLVAMGRISWY